MLLGSSTAFLNANLALDRGVVVIFGRLSSSFFVQVLKVFLVDCGKIDEQISGCLLLLNRPSKATSRRASYIFSTSAVLGVPPYEAGSLGVLLRR